MDYCKKKGLRVNKNTLNKEMPGVKTDKFLQRRNCAKKTFIDVY